MKHYDILLCALGITLLAHFGYQHYSWKDSLLPALGYAVFAYAFRDVNSTLAERIKAKM